MGENEERRRAQRQKRGLRRVEEILQVAGTIFAEVGYDKTTTIMIAARAGMSPGSLYQFFPNKEAIAQAFAEYATGQLHQVYDKFLSPEMTGLPFPAFFDNFVDAIIAFNQAQPGYFALSLGSTLSPSLALILAGLQQGIQARLDAIFAARWSHSTSEQRQLPILITYRIFLAILPLILHSKEDQQQAIVQEMKTVLFSYWEPILDSKKGI